MSMASVTPRSKLTSTAVPTTSRLLGLGRFDYTDIGEGSVLFGVVESITDNPFVANIETKIVDSDVNFGAS